MRLAAVLLTVLGMGGVSAVPPALAEYDPLPPPSPWGPGDEAGNSSTQTADKVWKPPS